LATANNQPTATGPFLGADWIDGYRCQSIRRNLAARSDWDVTSTMKLQTDQRSIPWEEMRDAVLAIPAADEDARLGLDLLRGWNGVVSADSPAAAVFELFVVQMVTRVARSKAPKGYSAAIGRGDGPLTGYNFFAFRRTGHLVGLLRTQPAGWFAAGWSAEIADALASVVRKLRVDRGSDPSSWAWGRLRTLTMTHPFGRGRVLAAVYNLGPIPFGGDADTINQGSVRPLEPFTRPDSIASLRAVIDVGAWENCRWVIPAGQSGNPLSPHYDDQWPLWQRGEGVPIAWGEDAVQKATRSTLTLRASS
jgi:penicillin amidase